MSKITNKVKETMNKGKEFVADHKEEIIVYGILGGISIGSIAYGVISGRKYTKAWRAAKEALDSGDMTADFGPYKIIEILEPKTMESLGKTVCHETTCEEFLKLK